MKKILTTLYIVFVVGFFLTLTAYRSQAPEQVAPTPEAAKTLYWGMSCIDGVEERPGGYRCAGYVIPARSVEIIYASVLVVVATPVVYGGVQWIGARKRPGVTP